jgi:magnesium-transporting ATPase (P-type)
MSAGAKRMEKRNVIVRNMKALEALGAVTGESTISGTSSSEI